MIGTKLIELGATDTQRLDLLKSPDRGGTPVGRVNQGELSEEVPRAEHVKHRRIAERSCRPYGESTLVHDMQ